MPRPVGPSHRVVLDTNIVVAGLLWSGPPRRLMLEAVSGSNLECFSSPVLIDELRHTLAYPKFAKRIEQSGTSLELLVAQYAALVSLVTPMTVPRVVHGDAEDDHVLAAALTAHADMVVTGDRRHLLPLGQYQSIAIVSAVDAIARLGLDGTGQAATATS